MPRVGLGQSDAGLRVGQLAQASGDGGVETVLVVEVLALNQSPDAIRAPNRLITD